jgi:hypothetical protein
LREKHDRWPSGSKEHKARRVRVGLIMAFIAGYVVGGRGGNEGFDEVVSALRALGESQEVEDLIKVLRSHAGHVLREVSKLLDPNVEEPVSLNSFIEKARGFVQRDATESAF